jgi:hypothetical protein
VKVGISAADITDVALEVLHVDGVEADNRCEKADVLFCEAVAEVVRTAGLGEVLFRTIQGLEELGDSLLVGFLGAVRTLVQSWEVMAQEGVPSKARLIDTIVDVIVSPFVRLLDLGLQVLRKQNHVLVLVVQEVVELGVEHANDLAGLVADDSLLLRVVQGGDGESALVVLVDVKVDIAQVREALVNGVRLNVLARLVVLGSGESPSLLEHLPVH